MIVPAGLPLWSRTASHEQYGGHIDKENYLSEGSIDETTDVDADELCRLAADVEAIARTVPFATITYRCNDGSPAAPTILQVTMATGVRLTSYAGDAAPSGFPSAVRSGTGKVTFTFGATYADPYGVSSARSAKEHACPSLHGSTAGDATATVTGDTVLVEVWDAAGAAMGDKTVTLEVW